MASALPGSRRTASSTNRIDRPEPCEDWRPYVVAAIPKPVRLSEPPEGVNGAEDGIRTRDKYPQVSVNATGRIQVRAA